MFILITNELDCLDNPMITSQNLPALPGGYALHFVVSRAQLIEIGRLGQWHFPIGAYFYLGSARGAGGLQARVGRYVRGDGARHWHIDYLRAAAEVRNALYTVTDTPLECVWSQALAQLPDAFIPVPHFGSSDCRSGCAAHLVASPRLIHPASIQKVLSATGTPPVVRFRCG
jgi:Uri superfamily endonuclease